jgi:putative membrane protein
MLVAGIGPLVYQLVADDADKPLSDEQFVQQVSAAGLAEVNLGRLAVDQASSAEVRKFGQRMIDDHTNANDELKKIADNERFTVAKEMDKKQRDLSDKLLKMKGEEFDKAFMKHMVKDHKEAVKLFEDESKNAKDADLKEFATKTLPSLKEHLKLARKLAGGEDKDKEHAGEKTRSQKDRVKTDTDKSDRQDR